MNTISRAAYEGDIVSRLRNWRGLHLAHSGELFEEAAGEIEKLRQRLRLADAALQSIGHNETDSPQAVASTPPTHATPGEGSVRTGRTCHRCGGDGIQLTEVNTYGEATCGTCGGSGRLN